MILLVRHASCEGLGVCLNGRSQGVVLSRAGHVEAGRLADRLSTFAPKRVLSSPRDRCMQTAVAIASNLRVAVEIDDDLDEVDFGAWTGRTFAELDKDASWRDWNERRSVAQAPCGESMADVQRRMQRALAAAAQQAAGDAVVLVSHAEPIRAALADVLGFSLDAWARLEISPAGVTRLAVTPPTLRICCINETIP